MRKKGNKSVMVYLDPDDYLVFRDIAYSNNRSMSAQAKHIIEKELRERDDVDQGKTQIDAEALRR